MLISKTEYAAKHNVSASTVSRMIADGRLKAQKIGEQWVIDDETPMPQISPRGRHGEMNRVYPERKCRRCGAVYAPKSSNAKYCEDCRKLVKAEQSRSGKPEPERRIGGDGICCLCGNIYKINNPAQKYCDSCRSVSTSGRQTSAESSAIIDSYRKLESIRATAKLYGISIARVRKALITAGIYENEYSAKAADLREQGLSSEEIAKRMKRSRSAVNANEPYTKGPYK